MSIFSDDTNTIKFKTWATQMGCPLELMPPDSVLMKTFGTNNGQRLLRVCRLVAPVKQVQDVRTNVLINKLRKYEENSGISKQGIPLEIQTLVRVRDLRAELKRIETQTTEKRERLDVLRENGTQLNQTYVQCLAENRVEQANVNLMAVKLRSLDTALKTERATSKTISSLIPVTLNPSIHTQHDADTAIADTKTTINELYQNGSPTAAPIELSSTNQTWNKLTQNVQHIPNCLLWSSIRSMQNRNLNKIKDLSLESTRAKQFSDRHSFRDYLEQFLLKARSKHIGIELSRIAVTSDLNQLQEDCVEIYENFYKLVHTRMEMAHDDYDNDRVDEYLTQFTTLYYNRGQLEFLLAEVEAKQKEYADRLATLNSHASLMTELQSVYTESDYKFHEAQDASAALYSIKEKLQSLESSVKSLVFEARQSSMKGLHAPSGRQQFNSSMPAGDSTMGSFNLSNNSVLCSTRLEGAADSSMLMTSMMENRNACLSPTLAPVSSHQPQQVNELLSYVESTLNAIVTHTSTMDTLQQLCHDSSTQIHGLQTDLYGMRSICQSIEETKSWNEILERFLKHEFVGCHINDFDEAALHERAHRLHNRLAELRDQCTQTIGACHQKQEMVQKLYQFLYENSLRLFLPASHTFNNRSYQDYEQEFMSLYSMVFSADNQFRQI